MSHGAVRVFSGLVCGLLVGVLIAPNPVLASGFVAEPGSVWAKISLSRWTADEKFNGPFDRDITNGRDIGDPVPFDRFTGGEIESWSLALDATVVVLPRFEVGLSFPFFQSLTFTDSTFTSTTEGTGDIWLRFGYALVETEHVGTRLNLHGKIPTSIPDERLESIPISEGQVDVAIEQVTTIAPVATLHISPRLLFRKRFPLIDGARNLSPGDEFELGLEVGGAPLRHIWLKAAWNALWSTGGEDQSGEGPVFARDKRQWHELSTGAYLTFGAWLHPAIETLALDLGTSYPIAGQDYPIGLRWTVGLASAHQF